MRFISFTQDGRQGLAIQTTTGEIRGRTEDDGAFPGTLDDLLHLGAPALASAAESLADAPVLTPGSFAYAPPLARPGKVLCIGLNYADHAAETNLPAQDYPTVFVRFPSNFVPHEAPLIAPKLSEQFDYEAELVAVIGKSGRNIAPEDALSHVAGYSIFNDGSIRDYQLRVSQWTLGKNFDGTGGFGPVFVTADELPEGARGLAVRTRVNGKTLQDGNTEDLIFDVATLVSTLSNTMTLEPGDMIVTGTPAGVGMARKPQVWLRPGDTCEIEVEGIGVLSNPVVAEGA